ncbi:MAG: hypothetical protein HQ538_05215 [Parcubacteria group bacterium]|nr:hypothetical protein [Parcubacteria group bacterium]
MNEKMPWLTQRKMEVEKNKMQFKEAFQELQNIIAILKEEGFEIPEYLDSEQSEQFVENQWNERLTFPIVRDGTDGMRAGCQRNGRFRVSFTNVFEEPDNPKRIEITKKLREKGFDVV